MNHGRTYEVFVNGEPIRLVGSTTKTLKQRCKNGYTRRFGPAVELRLIREVPRPEGYSDSDYNFYLKACEAMDIARKKTWIEGGGLNRVSPLIQAYGYPMLEQEMGRIGGRIGGRKNVESGQLARIRNLPQTKEAQREIGRKNAESGHLARICASGGRVGGRKAVESGQLARIRILPQAKEAQQKVGRKTVESGQLARMQVMGGRVQGRKNVENGHLASIRTLENQIKGGYKRFELGNPATLDGCRKGGRKGGRKVMESGHLAKIAVLGRRIGICQRWNINRGKLCVCGKHAQVNVSSL